MTSHPAPHVTHSSCVLSFRTSDGSSQPIRVRSIVGLIPLFACLVLEEDVVQKLPGFQKRMKWFMDNRQDIAVMLSFKVFCVFI